MNYLILGILILRKMTIYELRHVVRENFSSMCSDSMGAIQAALKRLQRDELVAVEECTERGVDKKYYSVTARGRSVFGAWVTQPADMTKAKNQELGKLLFMGMVPAADRLGLIDAIIETIEEELNYLRKVYQQAQEEKETNLDPDYFAHVCDLNHAPSIEESIKQVSAYSLLTARLGIDTAEFHLQWFRKVRHQIVAGEL